MRILLCSILFLVPSAFSAESPNAKLISVSGMGEVTGKPDMAQMTIGVTTEASTSASAVADNTKAMEKLFQTLKKQGIAEKDTQTTNFSIQPKYQYAEKQAPKITGYTVSNQVQVKVRALTTVGDVLESVVKSGANQVQGITFGFAEPEKLQDEARKKAMADAKRKADIYAKSADSKAGQVMGISELSAASPRGHSLELGDARFALAKSAVPIAAGEQTINVQITVHYKLEN